MDIKSDKTSIYVNYQNTHNGKHKIESFTNEEEALTFAKIVGGKIIDIPGRNTSTTQKH